MKEGAKPTANVVSVIYLFANHVVDTNNRQEEREGKYTRFYIAVAVAERKKERNIMGWILIRADEEKMDGLKMKMGSYGERGREAKVNIPQLKTSLDKVVVASLDCQGFLQQTISHKWIAQQIPNRHIHGLLHSFIHFLLLN